MAYFTAKDFLLLEKRYRTNLINSLSGFKSLNLVGTVNAKGITNLSIVSSVIHLGANPAIMGFIIRPITVTRNTYDNILETGHFTFNHIKESFYQQAHQCSARYDDVTSEFEATRLSPIYKNKFPAPYVEQSSIQIGLAFKEKVEIKLNGTILIIGSVEEIYAPKEVIKEDGYIDLQQAGTITCAGLDAYHSTNKLKQLSYAKVDRPIIAKDF